MCRPGVDSGGSLPILLSDHPPAPSPPLPSPLSLSPYLHLSFPPLSLHTFPLSLPSIFSPLYFPFLPLSMFHRLTEQQLLISWCYRAAVWKPCGWYTAFINTTTTTGSNGWIHGLCSWLPWRWEFHQLLCCHRVKQTVNPLPHIIHPLCAPDCIYISKPHCDSPCSYQCWLGSYTHHLSMRS